MKDLNLKLRTEYFERLEGAITYNGEAVKVYNGAVVPNSASFPYITIGNFNSTEIGEGTKESYAQECFLDVQVFTQTPNQFGGTKEADSISNQVTTLVRTRQAGYFDLSPNFQLLSIQLDNTTSFNEIVKNGLINRRILRFRHNIFEL
jgi:hypothetical protein